MPTSADDDELETFDDSVKARDRNADSGRARKRFQPTQATQILTVDGAVLGVDSTGVATASFGTHRPATALVPFGTGISEFDLGFDVVSGAGGLLDHGDPGRGREPCNAPVLRSPE